MRNKKQFLMMRQGGAAVVPPSTLLTGLAGYWKLNDTPGSGATFLDALGVDNLVQSGVRYVSVSGVAGGQGIRNTTTYGSWLSLAGNSCPTLVMGDIDFEICAWVYFDVSGGAGSESGIIDKYAGNPPAYKLFYTADTGLISWKTGANSYATKTIAASTYGAIPVSTWLFIDCYHDSVNNLMGISINRGVWDTIADTAGVSTESTKGAFVVGANSAPGIATAWRGALDEIGIWKKILTNVERDALYNGGSGSTYPFDGSAAPARTSILIYGDSKSIYTNTWYTQMQTARPVYIESPTRIAVSGRTVASAYAALTAELAATMGTPKYCLFNLGVNDALNWGTIVEADWKTQVAAIWEAMIAKWPALKIYVVYPWCTGQDANCNTIAGWFDTLRASHAYVFVGHNERVWLKGSDNGATMTVDGTHYTVAGEAECAAQWLAILPAS